MHVLTPILYPFAVVFDLVTRARNHLYDNGMRPSAAFDVPVIGVGNLSVGGTGKSPMIEYLVNLLRANHRPATLSRGYGRRSKGIRIVREGDNAGTVGDEPYQFFRKFKDAAIVAVGEDRALAIPHILQHHPDTDVVLLDDAFQHRRVKPTFQILLTDYNNLFVYDLLLPAGTLRESRRGASRADVVVVTKCPDAITDDEMMAIERTIRRYTNKAVFFARISYGDLLPVGEGSPYKPEKIVLVSGIASPRPLVQYVERHYSVEKHFSLRDHHRYTPDEMRTIAETASKAGASVVTTEKDMVKLDPEIFASRSVALYYLPIGTGFIKNGKEFDEMVLNAARSYGKS